MGVAVVRGPGRRARGTCSGWEVSVAGGRRCAHTCGCGVDPPLSRLVTTYGLHASMYACCCHAVRASATADRRACMSRIGVSACVGVLCSLQSVRARLELCTVPCRMSRGGGSDRNRAFGDGAGRRPNRSPCPVPCPSDPGQDQDHPACLRPHDFVLPREMASPQRIISLPLRCYYYSGRRGGQAS